MVNSTNIHTGFFLEFLAKGVKITHGAKHLIYGLVIYDAHTTVYSIRIVE